MLRGRVTGGDGTAVIGAEVRAGLVRSVSDSAGRWTLVVPALPVTLVVRHPGYHARTLEATRSPLDLVLQARPHSLDAIVVTAARREQQLKDVVPETRLISREQVEDAAAPDVAAALTQAAGLQLEGGVPAGSGVFLQGMDSRRVLVLLDGQPLVGRLNGNFDLSRLPASMIEQIEIVRGPQSTLYGSEAMGGVINIISRPPTQPLTLSLAALGGSQDRRELSAAARGSSGALGFVVDAGYRGESLAPGRPGDDATLARRWNIAPKLRWQAGEHTSVEVSGLLLDERQRYRTGQLFHFADNAQAAARLGLIRQRGVSRLAPVVSWSRYDHLARASTGASPASDSGAVDMQELLQAEVTWSFPVFALGVADVGAVARHEAIEADRVPGGRRSLSGVESYAQATWTIGEVSITPGVRLSSHEQWGRAWTPRVAVLWRPAPWLGVRASIGSGYRAPDFKELYLEFANPAAGYAVRGNPDLRPERSSSLSLGAEASHANLTARVSGFYNRFRDFIDYGPADATGTFTPGNIADGTTRGVDVEAGWSAGRLRVDGGYSYLEAIDAADDAPLLGRARHTARLAAAVGLGRARLSAAFSFTGRAPQEKNSSGTITAWRPSFSRADLRASFRVSGGAELHSAIENVFDTQMAGQWPGFTGRRLIAGIRIETAR